GVIKCLFLVGEERPVSAAVDVSVIHLEGAPVRSPSRRDPSLDLLRHHCTKRNGPPRRSSSFSVFAMRLRACLATRRACLSGIPATCLASRSQRFRTFLRAAAVLAGDFALPPLRPRATACGFLRLVTITHTSTPTDW